MADGIWEVVGGEEKGGIIVRTSKDVASAALADRIANGSLVFGLELDGDRLKYRRVVGEGPDSGWVSVRLKDKKLMEMVPGVWEVVGGADKGGILVREAVDIVSAAFDERLSTGALVRELDLQGDRLHFKRLSGTGPRTGWVSVRLKDRDLLVRIGSHAGKVSDLTPPVKPAGERNPGKRKMRILAMCGSLAVKEFIIMQTAQLKTVIGKHAAEWTFTEGSAQHPLEALDLATDIERQLAKGRALTSWYEDIYHCTQDRPTIEKQFDPEVRVESVDIPAKVELLAQYLEAHGPFDVIVAFSQACIMLNFLVGHLRKNSEVMPWRLSVFFDGMHIRDKRYFHLFETKSPHPTVLVFGKQSPYYDYSREGWCGPKPVEEYYENPVVLTHDEGHQFPTKHPRAQEVYSRVAEEMHRHCNL